MLFQGFLFLNLKRNSVPKNLVLKEFECSGLKNSRHQTKDTIQIEQKCRRPATNKKEFFFACAFLHQAKGLFFPKDCLLESCFLRSVLFQKAFLCLSCFPFQYSFGFVGLFCSLILSRKSNFARW